ncbi:hypothetical protein TrVFT333_005991 [Trichoderma virens FT-333]|nr:hypothetical protein TrVFT333_005991 [Trichoderma virens FT-333]
MSPRDSFWSVMVAFVVINSVTVGLRLWLRISSGSFGYDDWATCVAFGVFVVFCAFEFRALGYGYGSTEMLPGYNPILAAEFFVIAQLLYLIAQLAAKISVALVLYRIATMAPLIRKTLIASMAILSIVSVVAIFIFGFQCRPLSVAWGLAPAHAYQDRPSPISATEVGLAIFCASLAALKPLLKFIPWIPGSSKGTSKFESGIEPRGPSIRLQDRQVDTGSEESILPNAQHHIQKTTHYEVSYEAH